MFTAICGILLPGMSALLGKVSASADPSPGTPLTMTLRRPGRELWDRTRSCCGSSALLPGVRSAQVWRGPGRRCAAALSRYTRGPGVTSPWAPVLSELAGWLSLECVGFPRLPLLQASQGNWNRLSKTPRAQVAVLLEGKARKRSGSGGCAAAGNELGLFWGGKRRPEAQMQVGVGGAAGLRLALH